MMKWWNNGMMGNEQKLSLILLSVNPLFQHSIIPIFQLIIMKKTGSQIVVECLKKEGVDTLFNYPGRSGSPSL